MQQIRHRVEEPGLLERGLGPDGLVRLDGRDQAPDLATVLRHMGRHHLGIEAGQPRPQGLGEGLVGHRQVFLAATEEHERTLVVGAASQRRHQAGLAHPRFTGDEHRPTLTCARPPSRRRRRSADTTGSSPRPTTSSAGVAANAAGNGASARGRDRARGFTGSGSRAPGRRPAPRPPDGEAPRRVPQGPALPPAGPRPAGKPAAHRPDGRNGTERR